MPTPEELKARVEKAVADATVPAIYFNSFVITFGTGDIMLILERNGASVAKINMSFTTGKTLAAKLGNSVAEFERDVKRQMLTNDEVETILTAARGSTNAQ